MWRRRKTEQPESPEVAEARRRAEHADEELRRVCAGWPEVNRISEQLEAALIRNHFGESIELAFRRRLT